FLFAVICLRKGKTMQQDLWGDKAPQPRRRRKRNVISLPTTTSYSITGLNDCEILGHTLSVWDLAGCSKCIDCRIRVFCPICTPKHPTDDSAIRVYCPNHEESQASA